MSSHEREAFEQKLDANESLSDELMSIVALENLKRDLEKEFDAFESSHPHPGRKILFGKVSRIAAIILFLIIPSAFIVYYLNTPDHLISSRYMDYPLPGTHRSAGNSKHQTFSQAIEAFNRHKFEEAANLFSQEADKPAMADESHLYAGISLLWMKDDIQTKEAVKHFKAVLATKNDRNDAALWFLAISYFELGNKDEARLLFRDIADNPHHFRQQQAGAILEKYY